MTMHKKAKPKVAAKYRDSTMTIKNWSHKFNRWRQCWNFKRNTRTPTKSVAPSGLATNSACQDGAQVPDEAPRLGQDFSVGPSTSSVPAKHGAKGNASPSSPSSSILQKESYLKGGLKKPISRQ